MRESSRARDKDRGIALVLLNRLNERRLPQALSLKEKVERGERLSDYDLRFLKSAISESGEPRRLAKQNPQYQPLVDQMTDLYNEITRKARENEQNEAKGGTEPKADDL
jgi:hypothetical protein